MFADRARIFIKAGDGGHGAISFRREKNIPKGGPNGGDGGKGGSVILVVDPQMKTLLDFKYRQHFKAQRGENGSGQNKRGKDGEDLVLGVPPGTIVKDAGTMECIGDLVPESDRLVVARGGKGGRGNARFATSRRQAPRIASDGEPGEEFTIELELKIIADVGLVGLPNAGKSTLLSSVTSATPRIAPYPFTTLSPNLGVVGHSERAFVMADIPGLIEGAHQGKGLGHEFLRHVERTGLLLHVVDASAEDPVKDLVALEKELALYSPVLAGKTKVVTASKMDIPEAAGGALRLAKAAQERQVPFYAISAVSREGLGELIQGLERLVFASASPGSRDDEDQKESS